MATVMELTVWSGLAIAGGAVVGAIIAGWISRRTKISEFRQAWINDLREDISDYIGAAERWIHKWDELNSLESMDERGKRVNSEAFPIANEARTILYRIQLRFNPRDFKNPNKEADDAFLSSLDDLLAPNKLMPDNALQSWHRLASKSINLGRELLKREWEVTKSKWS